MSTDGEPFEPEPILQAFVDEGVTFVVVGGFAARVHGSTRPTSDVDVTPATDRENLARVVKALKKLDAKIRTDTVPGGLAFDLSAASLVGRTLLNLTTPGDLDLTIVPGGTNGYADLEPGAIERTVGHVRVKVAALADVIRSRRPPADQRISRRSPSCTASPVVKDPVQNRSAEHALAEAADAFPEEDDAERDHDWIDHVEVHVRCLGERSA